MIGNAQSIRFVLSILVVLTLFAGGAAQAAENKLRHPRLIEVFTTADSRITGESFIPRWMDCSDIELHVYELDGIQRIEVNLSIDLTGDPEQAKYVAIHNIQQLDEVDRAQMQHAALGLAKAMQYAIDRYPVIVFDGEAVVYGVTDLTVALEQYRAWHTGRRP
jgi:integrating conjugative element protein (TIGR03757 family)